MAIVAAATFIGSAIYTRQIIQNTNEENNLGATITVTELTNTIGEFRTQSNSNFAALNAQLTDSTSSNPGHTHTSSSITGVFGIANGGTGTSTFVNGIVVASGTNKMRAISTSANGQVLIASGTEWYANTLSAGQNITITNTTGTISIAGVAPSAMSVLGSTTLTSAKSTTTVAFTASRNLLIYAFVSTTDANTLIYITFNSTTEASTLYTNKISRDLGAINISANTNAIRLTGFENSVSSTLATVNVNGKGQTKLVTGRSIRADTTGTSMFDFIGFFNSSTPITQVNVTTFNDGILMQPGSYVTVYGSD